jgi:Flp pilus assembly protein TadG
MRTHTRIDIRSETGQTAVEFALVAPLLVVLLLAIIQVGLAFNSHVTVTDAARAGARRAVVARFSGASVADIEQAVRDAAGNLDQSKLKVLVDDPTWNVAGSDVTVTVTYPYAISLFGWVVSSGDVSSKMVERLE